MDKTKITIQDTITNKNNKQDNKYTQGGKFNAALFNDDFIIRNDEQIKYATQLEEQKLNEINQYYIYELKKEKELQKKELTMSDFLVTWINNIRDIIVDILKFNYDLSGFLQIFVKDNRLFYLGITIITVFLIYYFIKSYFFLDDDQLNNDNFIINNYVSYADQKGLPVEMAKGLPVEMAKETILNTTDTTITNSSGGYIFAEKY